MKAKLVAGGGIALLALIPFASLSKSSNSTPVQAAQPYQDLSSSLGLDRVENLDLLRDNSESSGGEKNSQSSEDSHSPSRPDVHPDILAFFTDPKTQPHVPAKQTTPFNFSSCKEVEEGPQQKKSFTCSSDQDKFSSEKDLLDHYLNNLKISYK